MKIITNIQEMLMFSKSCKQSQQTIAVVPTMGALHQGHLSLIDEAKKKADIVVVTIFVNPAQFNESTDLESYPRTFEADREMCAALAVDVIFFPKTADVYAPNFSTWVNEEKLSVGLCGGSRPGHFKGVTTVVAKLFNMVQPDYAVFGQKDAQQAMIITQMVRDLNFPIEMVIAPIVREKNGLAMSSRNKNLTPDEFEKATAIYHTLKMAENELLNSPETNLKQLRKKMNEMITEAGGKVHYIEIVRQSDLQPQQLFECPVIVAVAAVFGKARLIDNIFVDYAENES
jgi:pantoate--beta-alanine ligase